MSAMERFLSSFVDTLQKQYQTLHFNQFAEVHGYICFESDLGGKERLVLRERIQKQSNSEAISSECSKSIVFQAENAGKKTQVEIELNPEVRYTATTVKDNDDNGNCVESYDSDDFDTDMQVEDDESHPLVKVGLAAAPIVNSNDDPDCIILDDDDPKPEDKISPSATESQHVLSTKLPVDRGGLSQAAQEQTVVTNSEMIQLRGLSTRTDPAVDSDDALPATEYIDLDLSNDDTGTSSKSCVRERVSDGDNAQFGTEETCPKSSKDSPPTTGRGGRKRRRIASVSEAAMRNAVDRFISYNRCSKTFDPSTVTTEKLDAMLFEFFKAARTKTGQTLSPSSLQQLQINLDRAWSKGENPRSPIMITSSKLFPMSTDYLRKICGGKKLCLPKVKDIKTLFHNKKLGSTSPTALLNSMWFMNFKFFGIERPSDHADLKWGDIILKQDEDGTEYLKKNSQSEGSELLRICADPDKPAMCFVNLYKQYADRRPENMKNANSPFYLMPNLNPSAGASWFQSNKWYIQSFFNIWNRITNGTSLGELF